MEIRNFIVVDDKLKRREEQTYTVNGEIYIPLETTVPVIQKGVGCVGLGMVTCLVIRKDITTITFTVSSVSKEAADAYYSLYKNQVSMGDSDDVFDQSDVIIPGMMTRTSKNTSKPSPSYRDKGYSSFNRRSRGLSDYMEDDPHWD